MFVIDYLQSIAQLRTPEQLYDRASGARVTTAATSGTRGKCHLAADVLVVLVMRHFERYYQLP